MSAAQRIGKWLWILIFVGMVALALGVSVARADATLGWAIGVAGGAAIVVGIVLIWVRSRMKDSTDLDPGESDFTEKTTP